MEDHLIVLKKYLNSLINIEESSFNDFAAHTSLLTVKKGTRLLEAESRSEKLYFIVSGLFRIYHIKNYVEVNTCFCAEEEITCSFESFINQTISHDYIEAIEDSSVISISRSAMFDLIDKDPVWDELQHIFTNQECIRLINRVEALSFSSAQEKYAALLKNQKHLVQRIPVQYIASYLGISRETLSRVRSKMVLA